MRTVLVSFFLSVFTLRLGAADPDIVKVPDLRRCTIADLQKRYEKSNHLRVDELQLKFLHNNLRDEKVFASLCDVFGRAGVVKLRAFFKVIGNNFSPTLIDIDLKDAVLYYHPRDAVGQDLTKSDDWSGVALEDAANALEYAKNFLLAASSIRDSYLTAKISWADALDSCYQLDTAPYSIPEVVAGLKGALFSPKSDPQASLKDLKSKNPILYGYGESLTEKWAETRTFTGRIVSIDGPAEWTIRGNDGSIGKYIVCVAASDTWRQPIDKGALEKVVGYSEDGVLADFRYLPGQEQPIIVNAELKGISGSVITKVAASDGSQHEVTNITKSAARSEGDPLKAAVKAPTKAASFIKKRLGF